MTAKLKTAVKKRWVKALRSGDYKQAVEVLREFTANEGMRYCCLGVRGQLAVNAGQLTDTAVFDSVIADTGMYSYAERVLAWRDYHRNRGACDAAEEDLAEMNDNETPFPQIADHIDEHY